MMTASAIHGPEAMHSAHINGVLRARAEALAQTQEEEGTTQTSGMLLFRLGDEWYAFPIDHVREIYNDYIVTSIPRTPDYILGVINVRGEIMSVTDLGTMMRVPGRMARGDEGEHTSGIIVANETCVTAVVVDEISDILEVSRDNVEPALSTLDKTQAEFVAGSVYVDGKLIGIVNLDKVLEPIGDNT